MERHLIHNVTIHAMDEARTTADAMVWEGETLLALGTADELTRRFRPDRVIDGGQAAVLPGFIDPHIHFFDGAAFKGSLDCSPEQIPDVPALVRAVRERARQVDADDWIVGQGYDSLAYPGRRPPTRYDLDQACPDRPAVIFHYSMHECVVNSKTLALLDIDAATPQPGAGEIVKDRSGEPSGRLVEMPNGRVISMVRDRLITQESETIQPRLAAGQDLLFSLGITRIGDPAVSTATRRCYEQAVAGGVLRIPVVMYPCDDDNFLALPEGRAAKRWSAPRDGRLTVGPLKIFLDGAEQAAMRLSPFQGALSFLATLWRAAVSGSLDPIRLMLRSPARLKQGQLTFGVMMVAGSAGRACAARAVSNGYSLAFHAIGNRAVEQALALSSAAGISRIPPHRIEHGLFLTPKLIRDIRHHAMAVVTQPAFLDLMGQDNVPPLPGFGLLPIRSLLDAGILVAGSSDWPVVSCDPLLGIRRAVTRLTAAGEPVQPREAVSAREAAALYTCHAARVLGQADQVGSLAPGKRADFILLNRDPVSAPASDLAGVRVCQTWLGGERVFESM